ncbi:MAG: penicillin acylase family protein [Proteobacteria bacterium]|nr:penicillin acylase family protein [Pseudomonadota bacterium]
MRARVIAFATVAVLSIATAAAGEVTIHRDAMGVPHVFGKTSAEVLFGLGYAMAEDRLAQLELARRGAVGTRAEILGPGAVEGDETSRDRALSDVELLRMYRAIPAEHQAMMQRFVDGINRYIARIAADPEHLTPYEFKLWGIGVRPWTLLDYLGYVASLPKGRGGYELQNQEFLDAMVAQYGEAAGRQIFEDVVPLNDPDSPTTIPAGEDRAPVQPMPKPGRSGLTRTAGIAPPKELAKEASRCLVIGPERSASGHILMMEATADGPEAHLYGGGFNTAGFALPGWGPPTMGRSADHGWLLTSGHADTTDTYVERLNPHNRYQYWYRGAWRNMTHRSETIKVKGAAPVVHEVAATVHGPVVAWNVERGVAFTQRYAERGKELDTWVGVVEMARATNLADFESKGVARLAWNLGVCYGNSAGQFGFWEAGVLPNRPDGADSRLPTAGTGELEWTGFLALNEHPHMLNPKQGYIHTWNSKATSWMREGDEARIGKTFRTWLGSELAASGKALTLLDMREINRKIHNAFGAQELESTSPAFFAPYVREALQHSNDAELKRAGELMLSFSGLYEDRNLDGWYDDPGLTLFRTWLQVAPQVVFGPSIGDWWRKIDAPRYEKYQSSLLLRALQGDSAGLPLRYDYFKGRGRNTVLLETLRKTLETLRPKYPGKAIEEWRLPVFWRYFDPARETPEHPLLVGEGRTPARLWATLGLGPVGVPHNGGEEWVGLYELTPDHPVLYSVVEAGGQSQFIDTAGHGGPHLTDQVALHAHSEFKRIDMSPESVARDAVTTTRLSF